MGTWIGRNRKARLCYGLDDISLVPGKMTLNPTDVTLATSVGPLRLEVPIIAAAMDGVVDPKFAVAFGRIGGLAVLNLNGIYVRYDDPYEMVEKIITSPADKATSVIQDSYREPVKDHLIARRVEEIKKGGGRCAVSCIPLTAEKSGAIAQEAGADVVVVQSTVTTARHFSSTYKPLDLTDFCKQMKVPVIIGNCVGYEVALELMETGAAGILVGIGPGAACTSREVLGIGVPQVTSTCDCAAARDLHYKKTGKYVSIITDGGMVTSGDICKAFASGADAVMIGSAFVKAMESPGKGYHWGMATTDENLPRGTRINVGSAGTIKEILYGPSRVDDGSQNLLGALRLSMASLGVKDIREMQMVEIALAPSVKTEGKVYQAAKKAANRK